MEKTKDSKIIFNTLIQRMWKKEKNDPQIDNPFYLIEEIISYVVKLAKVNRFFDLKGNKFCFLESATFIKSEDKTITNITGLFKSARNEFRPNLINKRNGKERKNPKELAEGDIERTHFLIKIDKNVKEVYLFLEYNFHGASIQNIVNYFSAYCKKYLLSINQPKNFSINYMIIVRNSFLTELEALSRTRLAEIYFDKQLLGSKALNFSNRTVSVKKELKLVATASPRESITETAVDFFNSYSEKDDVTKVRIYGNDLDHNEVILDTTFMNKTEFLKVDINQETGEVNSAQLFSGLKQIANSF